MIAPSAIHPALGRYLTHYVVTRRALAALRALLWTIAFVLLWVMGWCVLDRLTALEGWIRAPALAIELLAVLAMLANITWELLRQKVNWIAASEEVEKRQSSLGQRLVTVISQSLSPASLRGSRQMLEVLQNQVTEELSRCSPRRAVPWRILRAPLAAAALSGVILLALFLSPWVGLNQLLRRHYQPFADLPPVSSTAVELQPAGTVDVQERDALVVRAVVRRSGGAPVPWLYVTDQGGQWARTSMIPAGENVYTLTLPGLDRDLKIYAQAEDARTPATVVRVLRKPRISEFRIRYSYPPYTGRPPLTVHNTDGLIEAPQGTQTTVAIVATEPLRSATLRLAGQPLEMTPAADPTIRQAKLNITRDSLYEVEMESDRGVSGRGPGTLQIRAVPDRPPLLRIISPLEDLRLGPRQTLWVTYQALDDYALASLALETQVNGGTAVEQTLQLTGDPRRVEGACHLDLASLAVKLQDVVTITLRGADKAGQTSRSEARQILVSPRPVDGQMSRRMAELSQAVAQSVQWAAQLDSAVADLEQAQKSPAGVAQRTLYGKISRQLIDAEESAGLLRQGLLRIIGCHASSRAADYLAAMADRLVQDSDIVHEAGRSLPPPAGAHAQAVQIVGAVAQRARDLTAHLNTLSSAEYAGALLADRINLASAGAATSPEPAAGIRRQVLERLRQQFAGSLAQFRINPSDPQVDQRLRAMVEAPGQLAAPAAVDWVAAARQWALAVRARRALPPLDERLGVAAQAQALRADGNAALARDLHLAGRAVAALAEQAVARDGADDPAVVELARQAADQLPAALKAMLAEHQPRQPGRAGAATQATVAQPEAARVAAAQSRAKMAQWIAAVEGGADDRLARVHQAEDLAMGASAATAARQFNEAAEMDQRLAALVDKPQVATASVAPRAIDAISRQQENLAGRTAREAASRPHELATAQLDLARDVVRAGAPEEGSGWGEGAADTREAALIAISDAQEKLAAVPSQLAAAQQAAAIVEDVELRLGAARAEALASKPAQQDMAQRVVRELSDELAAARQALDAASRPLARRFATDLAEALAAFAPETTDTVATLNERMAPALDQFRSAVEDAARGGEGFELESAARRVRRVVGDLQDRLREAQGGVTERDPLVAARWFAKTAAGALSGAVADPRAASERQRMTLSALRLAQDQAARRSQDLRLSQVPSFAPLYLPPVTAESDARSTQQRLLQTVPALREWGRMRNRLHPTLAPVRESEPAGYTDALRIYFEVLGKQTPGK